MAVLDSLGEYKDMYQEERKMQLFAVECAGAITKKILARLQTEIGEVIIIRQLKRYCSRIYSDGYVLEHRGFPPLATVQSYHSERIKAQRGVFTVFPFYDEASDDDKIRKMNINPDALENNIYAQEFLKRIVISNPQKVAYELLANGMNDSWLYPEMPIVSNVLENRMVFG